MRWTDATYWPFQTSRTCTVWLAIDDADEENAAMQFVSGSHRAALPWYALQLSAFSAVDQSVHAHISSLINAWLFVANVFTHLTHRVSVLPRIRTTQPKSVLGNELRDGAQYRFNTATVSSAKKIFDVSV